MTAHAHPVDAGHDQPQLPNQHFSSWLRGQTTLFVSQLVAVLGLILFVAEEVYYVSHLGETSSLLEPQTARFIVDCAHIPFMGVFILVIIQILDDNSRGSYRVKLVYDRVFKKHREKHETALQRSKDQLREFKRRFLWFWVGMLFLYVFFACKHGYELPPAATHPEQGAHVSVSVKGQGHGAREVDFGTYVNLAPADHAKAPESGGEAHGPGGDVNNSDIKDESRKLDTLYDVYKELGFPFLVFFFNNVTLLFIFWCFLVLYIPPDKTGKRDLKYRVGSAVVVGVLTLLFLALAPFKGVGHTVGEWRAYSSIFDTLSGVVNAVALALLIARLDSKLIGLRSWLICILYSYAAVQPLFIVFELTSSDVLKQITTWVLIVVFVSKIYFFLIIIYALQTGKMLNYLFCFPVLRGRAKRPGASRAARTTKAGQAARNGRISNWLKSSRPLTISKWLGLITISYFFISLVSSQLTSEGSVAPAPPSHGAEVLAASSHAAPEGGGAGGSLHGAADEQNAHAPQLSGAPAAADAPAPNPWEVRVNCANLAVVFVMMIVLLLLLKENDSGDRSAHTMAKRIFRESLEAKYSLQEAKKQLKKFKKFFLYFWCATFLVYLAFLLESLRAGLPAAGAGAATSVGQVAFYAFLGFCLNCLNLLFAFWCFVVLRTPAFDPKSAIRQRLLVNYSSFVMALLVAIFLLLFFIFITKGPALSRDKVEAYVTVFDGVVGTLSAITLALLIARTDSKLFGLPRWSIWLLFAYASIQPLYVAFALDEAVLRAVKMSVLVAALGLKVCFFLIMAHSLQSGGALTYLCCFPFLKDRVDSIFENQLEIRLGRGEHHSFTLSILKKNHLYYSTETTFKTRKECDTFVHALRALMKDRKSYRPLPPLKDTSSGRLDCEESGTHWVEVRSADGDLICESVPLKSEDEVNDLISESMDKIPYCKYNRI